MSIDEGFGEMEKLKKKHKLCYNNKPWNNQNITDTLIGTHGTGHKGISLSYTHSPRICDCSLDAIREGDWSFHQTWRRKLP
mgnify:FL=1